MTISDLFFARHMTIPNPCALRKESSPFAGCFMIRSCWVGGSVHIVQQKLKRKRHNPQKANQKKQKKHIWLATIADRFYFSPLEIWLQLKMINPQLIMTPRNLWFDFITTSGEDGPPADHSPSRFP